MKKTENVEVSEFDIKALKIIRNNVSNFLSKSAKLFDKYGLLLEIGPQEYQDTKKYFKKIEIQTLDINPNAEANYIGDITKKNKFLANNSFDIIVATEVLEHVLNPFAAIEELYRILKFNGILLISVPFNFRIHGPLPDCWRFTEYGLSELLKKFNSIEIKKVKTNYRDLMPIHYTIVAKK